MCNFWWTLRIFFISWKWYESSAFILQVRDLSQRVEQEKHALVEKQQAGRQELQTEIAWHRDQLKSHIDEERATLRREKQEIVETAKARLKSTVDEDRQQMLKDVETEKEALSKRKVELLEFIAKTKTYLAELETLESELNPGQQT